MKVLVTGGAGYVGSHTAVELIKAGYEAVIVDDLSTAKTDVVDRIETITGVRPVSYHLDCKDKEALGRVFSAHEIGAVIHFAGLKAVGESVSKPLEYYRNNLMPYIGRVAAGQLEKLTIFGGDYATPDGTCQRDYLHVVDLAVGHLKALEFAVKYKGVEAVNLGTGNGVSVLELVNAFNKANDMELPYVIGPRRDSDLPAFWADAGKAEALLGWKAAHTVEDMCRSAWNFAKNAAKN